MKANILLLMIAIVTFASCATFKSGQTPDDVYYSTPKKLTEEESKKDEVKTKSSNEYNYEDRSIKMRTTNYRRWSSLEEVDAYKL
jgi:fibrillarin-like rRNA methylase